ncbi:hypothetical protein [Nocardia sp. NRRL S-836]|uniref:hypothetical protein n=1 Tax=Nocardia sp. NRRL S-836 TaxID=1519492 RepID=UPI0006AFF869|nr:hypothetical protein [Nocardia sp. NRRL S-836]KOV81417.1 hypothetical protein ADL03_28475 [Nocardia sp. NRRL S-836]
MQLPQRVLLGAIAVPLLLASVGVAVHAGSATEPQPAQLVLAVRSAEVVLAGAATPAERQEVVDAVRSVTAAHRITDMITPSAGAHLPVAPAVAASVLRAALGAEVIDFTAVVQPGHLIASAHVTDHSRAGALSDALRAAAPDLRVDEDFTTTG